MDPTQRPRGPQRAVRPHAPEPARSWFLLVRWYWRVLVGASVVVAGAGALTAPAHLTLLVGPAVAVLSVAAIRLGAACTGLRRPSPRTVGSTALAGLLLVPFLNGVPLFGAAGAALLMTVLFTVASRVPAALVGTEPTEPLSWADVERLCLDLPGLRTAVLVEHWQRTARQLGDGTGPEALAAAAAVRSALLDEFTRRDPAGVERWLRSGGDQPGEHLAHGDADRTA